MTSKTPRGQLEVLLTAAQKNWRVALDGPEETRSQAIIHTLNYFSAAWYLRALLKAAPAEAAKACVELLEILEDGGAVGEWTWELLSGELGIDPETVAVPGLAIHAP